jgi:hypothetical protein
VAKTYTSVPTVSTLATYPSATYNTYTAQNINNLIVPPYGVRDNHANRLIANTTWAFISFTARVLIHGMFAPTDTKITIQTAGVYLVTAQIKRVCEERIGLTH